MPVPTPLPCGVILRARRVSIQSWSARADNAILYLGGMFAETFLRTPSGTLPIKMRDLSSHLFKPPKPKYRLNDVLSNRYSCICMHITCPHSDCGRGGPCGVYCFSPCTEESSSVAKSAKCLLFFAGILLTSHASTAAIIGSGSRSIALAQPAEGT